MLFGVAESTVVASRDHARKAYWRSVRDSTVAERHVVVVGGGHNGLVAACYLARAGASVTVLEQHAVPGGGSRTEETIPGFYFDTHSAAHNIINMTSIPAELDLASTGLRYLEMDPFAVGISPGESPVRFFRSIDKTVAALAEVDPAEAGRYAAWMEWATPLIEAAVAGLDYGGWRRVVGVAKSAVRAARRAGGPLSLTADMLAPYGALLGRTLSSERLRAPVAAFAAHASVGPQAAGGAFFAIWQAAYHRFGQWHAAGGARALTDALSARLDSLGGRLVTGRRVVAIETEGGAVTAARTDDGVRFPAVAVLAAIDPRVALELVDPLPSGSVLDGLRGAHAGNAVQLVVHVATTALPPYPDAAPGDWNGLQSHVGSVDELARGFARAEARLLPDPPPTYAFTPSAMDPGLAPPGRHGVYLACPCAPAVVEGGWAAHAERFAEAMIDRMEVYAPGFRDSVIDVAVRTPEAMAADLGLPGAHPMHLDVTVDQLGPLRPTQALGRHRTPIAGLLLAGAGAAPVGGISGLPGRGAAHRLLGDWRHRRY